MLPIAAPAIAAPAVAPANATLSDSAALPGTAAAAAVAASGAADPAMVESSLFAVLLAPLATPPVAQNAILPSALADTGETPVDAGLAQLLSAWRSEADGKPEEAQQDGELLALLAGFAAAMPQTAPAGEPVEAMLADATTPAALADTVPAVAMPSGAMTGAAGMVAVAPMPELPLRNDTSAPAPAAAPQTPAISAGLPAQAAPVAVPVPLQPAAAASPAAPMSTSRMPVPAEGLDDAAMPPAASLPSAAPALVESVRQPLAPATRLQNSVKATSASAVAAGTALPAGEPSVAEPIHGANLRPTVPATPSASDAPVASVPAESAAALPMSAPEALAAPVAPGIEPAPMAAPTTAAAVAPPQLPPQTASPASAQPASAPAAEPAALPDAAPAAPLSGASSSPGEDAGQTIAAALRSEPVVAAGRSEAAQPASRPDPNPLERAVAHQVSRAIVQHLPDGGARMVMRLTPPELGTVRIEFIARDGMVTARLMAEDEGVRQALDRALPHIRAEVRGDHPAVDISVDRSDQRQAWGEGHARQERRDEPRAGQGRRPREDDPVFTIDGAEPVVVATPLRAPQQLGGRVGPTLVDALA